MIFQISMITELKVQPLLNISRDSNILFQAVKNPTINHGNAGRNTPLKQDLLAMSTWINGSNATYVKVFTYGYKAIRCEFDQRPHTEHTPSGYIIRCTTVVPYKMFGYKSGTKIKS